MQIGWKEIEESALRLAASAAARDKALVERNALYVRVTELEAAHQQIVDLYLANVGTMLSGEVCNQMAAISKKVLPEVNRK